MTAIPDIPIPDKFEATHTTPHGNRMQALVTIGRWTWGIDGDSDPEVWNTDYLTPLPPPLPKARVGWYVLTSDGYLEACRRGSDEAWSEWERWQVNVAVVKLCADGVLRHVDRDGNEGAPLEVEP